LTTSKEAVERRKAMEGIKAERKGLSAPIVNMNRRIKI
jgi:hypothetical protein